MAKIAIVYHSGYGHTKKLAEVIQDGAIKAGADAELYNADDLASPETGPWDELAKADAIVFGAPTYMGSASAGFKAFADASSKAWFTGQWKDKLAGGFTTSGSPSGDKSNTLAQMATLASQHGMIWVSTGMMPGFGMADSDYDTAINRQGFFLGVGVQAKNGLPPEQAPDAAELETGRQYGARIAHAAARWTRGAA